MACLAVGLFAVACDDSFTDVSDPNSATPENFLTSVENFDSYLTGVYSKWHDTNMAAHEFYAPNLQGMGLSSNQSWTGFDRWNQLFQHDIEPSNGQIQSTWDNLYEVILNCNDLVTQAQRFKENSELSSSEEQRLERIVGQAYFWRAFTYFHLVRLYGVEPPGTDPEAMGVPLILEVAENRDEMQRGRNTVGEVYDQILADFKAARDRLPPSWSSDNQGRPTEWAMKGFIGKVHLYRGNWSEAEAQFTDIINSGPYSLADSSTYYTEMFHEEGDFASGNIFEFNFLHSLDEHWWGGGPGHFVASFNGPRGAGFSNFHVHDRNIERFGNDPRLEVNAIEPGVDTLIWDGEKVVANDHDEAIEGKQWSHRKYVWLTENFFSVNFNAGSNIIVMRLADVKLMLAEALNEQGDDAAALEQVNQVRRRAYGEPVNSPSSHDYSGLTGNALRDTIREERFRELFAEGHRWYDLQRWEIVEEEFAKYDRVKSGPLTYDGRQDEYWPIPQSELDANPEISQSPDYQ